jgi:predicted RNA-binding Zn ribbon-like protein
MNDRALTWTWLEGYPALDFANTVMRRGWAERDLVQTVGDLDSWLDAAALPAPRPARVTEQDLAAFRRLRDPALRLLRAAAGHGGWRASDRTALNTALMSGPEVTILGRTRGTVEVRAVGSPRAFDMLLTRLAAETRDVLTGPREDLALCDAPGCGLLFFRHRANQEWCGPPCGNRARVARHSSSSRPPPS